MPNLLQLTLMITALSLIFVAPILLLAIGNAPALLVLLPVLGIVFATGLLARYSSTLRARSRVLGHTTARLESDGPDVVLAELDAQPPRDPVTGAILHSAVYAYKGDGERAEDFAHNALDLLEERHTSQRSDFTSRMLAELAHIALYDALVAQGHFAEAAGTLHPVIDRSLQPAMLSVLVVWALYLGEQYDDARTTIKRLAAHIRAAADGERHNLTDSNNGKTPPVATPTTGEVPPKYLLMLAHMRHALDDDATACEMQAYRETLNAWQDEAQRNAHNPYGTRLHAIIDNIHAQLDTHPLANGEPP